MLRIAGRAKIALLLALVLVLGSVFFCGEYLFQSQDWIVFSGSPHVYRGGNLNCGTVVDRSGELLLDATEGRSYSDDLELRMATMHLLGDRYGYISAPALAGYSSQMVGFDKINGIYSPTGTGGTAVLTLSAQVQKAALEALDGRKGTIGVYNYKTGEILCAVTSPTFDPDDMPDIEADESGEYDGVYVNRFTQSAYVPGSIFKAVTTAAALETIPDILSQTFFCEGTYEIEGDEVVCEGVHGEIDLEEALMYSCNCAFAQLAQQLGADTLAEYVEKFQVTQPITFDGITTAQGNFDIAQAAQVNVAWASIGQYTDTVNPCRFMTFMGAIAGGGVAAQPYLVQSVSSGLLSSYQAHPQKTQRILSSSTASQLQNMMRNNVVSYYGDGQFPDIQVCAKSGTAELGGGLPANTTFAGFTLDEEYPLAFIVVVEQGGGGASVGAPTIAPVLQACVEAMDQNS